jgi:hypothetical protein
MAGVTYHVSHALSFSYDAINELTNMSDSGKRHAECLYLKIA